MVKAQQAAEARALLEVPMTEEPMSTNGNANWWKRIATGSGTVGKVGKRADPFRRPSTAV